MFDLDQLKRCEENHFTHTKYIKEFWNTLSNLPFIIFGLRRLSEANDPYLWYFMIAIGFGSGIHHMFVFKNSLVVDYIPIVSSIVYTYYAGYLNYLEISDIIDISIPLFVLVTDHLYKYVPIPWGHVMWHLLAAYATCIVFMKFDSLTIH